MSVSPVSAVIRFQTPGVGQGFFSTGWAAAAAAAGHRVLDQRDAGDPGQPADLIIVEGAVALPLPPARRRVVVDDGSSGPDLRDRLRGLSAEVVVCPDPDRSQRLAREGLPTRALAAVLDLWRWARPVRPILASERIVLATDAAAGLLAGMATLPLPELGADPRYAPSVQAVALSAPERQLPLALVALATGLPLILPPAALPWLGPLAALRVPLSEVPQELSRLASPVASWFDQVETGRTAVRKAAHPARFLSDLATLLAK